VSSQAAATAQQDGRETPAKQVKLVLLPPPPVALRRVLWAPPCMPLWLDLTFCRHCLIPPFPADVDECSTGGASCPQHCINTAGSYWCQCWKGHSPSADGTLCLPKGGPPRLTVNPMTGKLAPHSTLCVVWGGGQMVDIQGPVGVGTEGSQPWVEIDTWEGLSPGILGWQVANILAEGGRSLFSLGRFLEDTVGRAIQGPHVSQASGRRPPSLGPSSLERWQTFAGDGPLLLLVRAVTLQTRTVSNNALSAAQHEEHVRSRRGPPSARWGLGPQNQGVLWVHQEPCASVCQGVRTWRLPGQSQVDSWVIRGLCLLGSTPTAGAVG
jgi:hypothetical protein